MTTRPPSKPVERALAADDMLALAAALTDRQRKFCEEWSIDLTNAKAAAIRAGYSSKGADQQAYLLKMNPGVIRYTEHLSKGNDVTLQSVDPDYVIKKILRVIDKPGARDGDVLRGLELIAKYLGMFIERTEISGKDGEAIQYKKVQEDASTLASAIAGLRERGGDTVISLFPVPRAAS